MQIIKSTTRHNGIRDSAHTGLLIDSQDHGDASKRGGGGKNKHVKRTVSKDEKGCRLRVLLPNTLLRWVTMVSLNALLSLSLSLPLIHKYIYWIWDPFRCLVTFCTLYVKLCHTLYAFKSCGCAVPSQPCLQRITESQRSLDSRIKEMSWFCNQGLRVVEHLGR